MELSVWLALFAASWAISVSPGAGAVAAMNAGLTHGFKRGYITTVGLILGIMTQLVLVSVGLGALVASSAMAFEVVKWFGVAYLIYLGVSQWRAPLTEAKVQRDGAIGESATRMILKGWLINAANPKGTVFLLAVVPQFLNLNEPLWLQYVIIGATLTFTDLVVMAGYTALAARIFKYLKSPRHVRFLNRVFGGLFVVAGISLSFFKRAG
ncbi:LysE family transporter [Orrella daihaiensis]|uniref:LysE family transporter n=1 Tax=Orrella daihaiensis TaxID=2782176 RepID=A0ABY4AP05_9BURK|nr:LysE family transporter [Orrella daihaiensis]UOD49774.1 LysE family transporter [Orrella daihaiensis]